MAAPQKLTSPQKKEWEALMVFLVQQVDPRWAPPAAGPDGKTKYEVRDSTLGYVHLRVAAASAHLHSWDMHRIRYLSHMLFRRDTVLLPSG